MSAKGDVLVYGPVPSRRLGLSLGIDPVPKLTCTFDCVYCQLGKKRYKVRGPEEVDEAFPTPERIADSVVRTLEKRKQVDYVTFSGSGEPTLNPSLGEAIERIRRATSIPIALVTNSSLLTRPEVLDAAAACDLVLPSLDAGDQETFELVNRPASGFEVEAIARAIGKLARRAPVWLEVMLVHSQAGASNIGESSVGAIIDRIGEIRPDEVNLNTCVRPPEEPVEALSEAKLQEIRERMEEALPEMKIRVVAKRTASRSKLPGEGEISRQILDVLSVRPCTTTDLCDSLGINPAEVGKYLARLADDRRIERLTRGGRLFYTTSKD